MRKAGWGGPESFPAGSVHRPLAIVGALLDYSFLIDVPKGKLSVLVNALAN